MSAPLQALDPTRMPKHHGDVVGAIHRYRSQLKKLAKGLEPSVQAGR